jgi:hypothetical protein
MVEKITKDLLNKVINEIKKEENQHRIEIELLNPLIIKIYKKIYPYIKIGFVFFILNFFLIFIILILTIKFNYINKTLIN